MGLDEVQAGGGGVAGALARAALRLLSFGWAAGTALRRAVYRLGLRRTHALPVPVVSVGNLAVGGTGKTPFTAWLAGALRDRGVRPAILSRGYGPRAAGASGLSDEGAVLRHLLGDDVPLLEDPDRPRGGRRLLAEHPATDVVLLDDGFQHWRLRRDLDVVLLDATNPLGHGFLLPRGRLREPPRALRRAGLVVLTRAERLAEEALAAVRGEVAVRTTAAVAVVRTRAVGVEVAGHVHPPAWLEGRTVFAACGIGNPRAFAALLEDHGARLGGRRFLADHAPLPPETWAGIRREARDAGAELVVVTRKDAVKLPALEDDVGVLDVAVDVVRGEDDLWAALRTVLPGV